MELESREVALVLRDVLTVDARGGRRGLPQQVLLFKHLTQTERELRVGALQLRLEAKRALDVRREREPFPLDARAGGGDGERPICCRGGC